MTQRERIAELETEVDELRKQLSALSVAIVELAAKQPVQYVPYYVQPYTPPTNPWPYQPTTPWISYSTKISDNTCSQATLSPAGGIYS